MIITPVNSNSISIPLVQNGYLKSEFNSTYPIHLNGIISQIEFQESISNINHKIPSNIIFIIYAIILVLSIISGTVLFIVGIVITAVRFPVLGFVPLISVGIALFIFVPIFVIIRCYVIQIRHELRIEHAIAEESMKYSSKTPILCRWRLDILKNCVGEYKYHHNSRLKRYLVIDIGRVAAIGSGHIVDYSKQVVPESKVFIKLRDNSSSS